MTDVFGTELRIGDKIIFTKQISTNSGYGKSLSRSSIITGRIKSFRANNTQAVVDLCDSSGNLIRHVYLKPDNVVKYEWTKEIT